MKDLNELKTAINAHLEAIEDAAAIALQDGTMNPSTILYHAREIRRLQMELTRNYELKVC